LEILGEIEAKLKELLVDIILLALRRIIKLIIVKNDGTLKLLKGKG